MDNYLTSFDIPLEPKKNNFSKFISNYYLIFLIYNILYAKPLPFIFALVMYIYNRPKKFANLKTNYKKAIVTINLLYLVIQIIVIVYVMIDALSMSEIEIPYQEQQYIDQVLSQITVDTTKDEALALFGTPDRDMVLKTDWWVDIDGKESRLTLYFNAEIGTVYQIILNGGVGRFYFVKEL